MTECDPQWLDTSGKLHVFLRKKTRAVAAFNNDRIVLILTGPWTKSVWNSAAFDDWWIGLRTQIMKWTDDIPRELYVSLNNRRAVIDLDKTEFDLDAITSNWRDVA